MAASKNVTVTESCSLSVVENAYCAYLAIANPNLAPVVALFDRGFPFLRPTWRRTVGGLLRSPCARTSPCHVRGLFLPRVPSSGCKKKHPRSGGRGLADRA